MVHYVNFFNTTDAEEQGILRIYFVFFSFELVIMIFASLIVSVIIYLNIVTRLYHRNMRLIFSFYISTYLIHNIGNVTQNLLILFDDPSTSPDIFRISSYFRVMTLFCAVLILPAFVCERLCATHFLSNYETKQRPWIGRLIVVTNGAFAVALGALFQSDGTIRYYVIFFVLINAISHLVNLKLANLNKSYYYQCQNGRCSYSLAQRFQISENIKAAKIWSKVGLSIAFFNVVCVLALLVDDFAFSANVKNMAVVVFNYCVHCYAVTLCVVTYNCNKPWKMKLYKILKKQRIEPIERSLRNSFGQQMHVTRANQTDAYFNMLKKDWS